MQCMNTNSLAVTNKNTAAVKTHAFSIKYHGLARYKDFQFGRGNKHELKVTQADKIAQCSSEPKLEVFCVFKVE